MQPLVGSEGVVPAGYEIRWWAPSGHDVAADVLLFEDADIARDFFDRAVDTRCREAATTASASYPTGGVDLEWRNPYGYMQQDLFLVRGPRVYRFSVVRPQDKGVPDAGRRKEGFRLVNSLGAPVEAPRYQPDPGSAA